MLIRSLPNPSPEASWNQAPLFRYVLLVIAGIGLSWILRETIVSWMWLCGAAFTTVLGIIFYLQKNKGKEKTKRRFFQWAVFCGSCSWILGTSCLTSMSYEKAQTSWPDYYQIWTAEVCRIHKTYEHAQSADVRLLNTTADLSGKTIRLRLEGNRAKELQPGDRLAFHARIRHPKTHGNPGDFDYHTYLLTHGISGTSYANDSSWIGLHKNPNPELGIRLLQIRKKLVDNYRNFFEQKDFEILAALTLGEKSTLHQETRDLFSETGTSHILALSGLHLGILFFIFRFVFLQHIRRRSLFIASNLTLVAALWIFVLLVGAPLSLIRSAWMLTLLQIGLALQRTQNASLNHLSFAALSILLYSPLALFDVGFQLSFAAVLSIILLGQYLWNRFPLPEWQDNDLIKWMGKSQTLPKSMRLSWTLRKIRMQCAKRFYLFFSQTVYPFLTVSISAQFGTAALVIYYFHNFTPYTLLANFIVIPAAYLLLAAALLFFLIPVNSLRLLVAAAMHGVIALLTQALEAISQWPAATLHLYPSAVTLMVLTLLPILIYLYLTLRPKRIRVRLIYITTFMLLIGIGDECFHQYRQHLKPQIIVYDFPRSTVVHFIVSARQSYLYSTGSRETVCTKMQFIKKNFFEPHRMEKPQWITQEKYKDRYLIRNKNLFVFGHENLLLLKENVRYWKVEKPLRINTLLIGYGCRDSLATVQKIFHPQRVVLDGTLSAFWRKKWKEDCQREQITCHDIREEGAYIQEIN